MGLFGDKKLKALDEALRVGPMALDVGLKTGRGQVTFRNVIMSLAEPSRSLAQDGRKAEAIARLRAALGTRTGDVGQLWDIALREVIEKVETLG